MAYGVLQLSDTLQTLRVATGTVAQYGEDRAFEAVEAAFVAHNQIVGDLLNSFVSVTTNRLERIGTPDSAEMEELGEFGTTEAQKIGPGPLIGLPVRRFGRGLAWNRDWVRRTTTRELEVQIREIFSSDARRIQRQIKRALYMPTNYTFTDVLTDFSSLPVKALANNDGMVPPIGPNGEVFAGTHQHYLGTASFAAANLDSLINTVAEHMFGGNIYLGISTAQEVAIRGFTGFTAYYDARVTPADSISFANSKGLDTVSINNRPIGIYNGAEVWVKPWAISSYVAAWGDDPQQKKALGLRILGDGPEGTGTSQSIISGAVSAGNSNAAGDLQLVYDNDDYPLRAREYVREFDVAVLNRVAAAVLYIGNATYQAPTIS